MVFSRELLINRCSLSLFYSAVPFFPQFRAAKVASQVKKRENDLSAPGIRSKRTNGGRETRPLFSPVRRRRRRGDERMPFLFSGVFRLSQFRRRKQKKEPQACSLAFSVSLVARSLSVARSSGKKNVTPATPAAPRKRWTSPRPLPPAVARLAARRRRRRRRCLW